MAEVQPIALQVQTPAPISPLASVGALMQLRSGMAEAALRASQAEQARAQTADIQAQAEQRRRANEATQKLTGVLADTANHESFAKGDFSPIWKAGVSPEIANPAIKGLQEMQEKAQTLRKGQAEFYAAGRERLKQGIEGLDPDDKLAADQFRAFKQNLAQEHPELSATIPDFQAGPQFRQQLKDLAASNNLGFAMLNDQAAREKTLAEIKKEGALTAEADSRRANLEAERPGIAAEAAGRVAQQPVTEAVAKATLADKNLLTPEQRIQATHNANLEQIQRGELGIKQAKQNLDSKEFEVKYGSPTSRSAFTDMVAKDPDAYFSLPPELKIGVANDLVARGIAVPAQLPADLKNRAVSAALSLATIDRVQKLLADPDVNANGPLLGRLGNIEQGIGIGGTQKEQELRTALNILQFQEAKGLIGGRPAHQLMESLKATSANPKMGTTQIQGALKGMADAAKSVGEEAHTYSFGGAGAAASRPATIRARDPQGKLHEAPAGTPLPPGWKLE